MHSQPLLQERTHAIDPSGWPPLSLEDTERLAALQQRFEAGRAAVAGYPVSQVFDYGELFRFLEFAGNNVGDPFAAREFGLDTHEFERDVIRTFADLLHANAQDTWGYVTSGGTEGNLYALDLARECYPDGVIYYSDESHYSVPKTLRIVRGTGVEIATDSCGVIDYAALASAVASRRSRPAIVVANIGTTIKGAIDDVGDIRAVLAEAQVTNTYIHCDAALAGLVLPFVDAAPAFDFAAGADSIAISGHKLIGAPLPSGVVVTKRTHAERLARHVPYLNGVDATIAGSRSAFGPLMLWYALRRLGREGLAALVARCFELADYTIRRFASHGIRAWRNVHSIVVIVPRPSPAVLDRWQMAARDDIAQIVALPHLNEETIDRLASDIAAHDA